MGQGASLLDVLIDLLQSIVVLLLASGVYFALVVRKGDAGPPKAERETPPAPRFPRNVT